jgi:putative spermidine/putrescine transport system permease protein
VTAAAATPSNRRRLVKDLLLCMPALVLALFAIVAPLALMLLLSFLDKDNQFTLENYARLSEPLYLKGMWTTIKVAFAVTLSTVLLGYPLSYFLARLVEKAARVVLILVLLPFWTSALVRTYAWLVPLQRKGIINSALAASGLIDAPLQLVNNFLGTTIGMTHVLLPFLILPLYANMRAIPLEYLRAASAYGASPARAFWDVFFPLSIPGLVAGSTLVFVLSVDFFVTPAILGGGILLMWVTLVQSAVNIYPNWGAACALGISLLAATLLILRAMKSLGNRLASRRGLA